MSWLGEVVGDRAPQLKNLHNVLWTKLAHNNFAGKIKHFFRGFKAQVVDAKNYCLHKVQDIGLHFKRMNQRNVRLYDLASHGQKLTKEEATKLVNRGDAVEAKVTMKAWLDFINNNKSVIEVALGEADQRITDEKEGKTQGIKDRMAATAADNRKYLAQEMLYPDHNPNFTKDMDMHALMHGERSSGVKGIAHYFKNEMKTKLKENGRSTDSVRDDVLQNALRANKEELEARYKILKDSIAARVKQTEVGEGGVQALSGGRMLQVEAAAIAEAIDYTNLCLDDKEERAELMGAYSHTLGIHSSVRSSLGTKPQTRRAELRGMMPKVGDQKTDP